MVGSTKSNRQSVKAKDVKEVQQEIQSLQKALSELVDALITEGKPGPKENKKLQAFKKRAQNIENNFPKKKKPRTEARMNP